VASIVADRGYAMSQVIRAQAKAERLGAGSQVPRLESGRQGDVG